MEDYISKKLEEFDRRFTGWNAGTFAQIRVFLKDAIEEVSKEK